MAGTKEILIVQSKVKDLIKKQQAQCSADAALLHSRWHTQVYRARRTWSYAGSYRHTLLLGDGRWRIAHKYIVLTNDLVDTTLDLYHV